MTSLIERRLTRLERRLGVARIPSRWAQVCAPPAISVADLREAIKTLIATAPVSTVDNGQQREQRLLDATVAFDERRLLAASTVDVAGQQRIEASEPEDREVRDATG